MIPSHVPHSVFVTSEEHNPESEEPIWPISNDYRSCIWDWSEMEAGKESALIVANAIMTNCKYFWCLPASRESTRCVRTVVFGVTWVMFTLRVRLCLYNLILGQHVMSPVECSSCNIYKESGVWTSDWQLCKAQNIHRLCRAALTDF